MSSLAKEFIGNLKLAPQLFKYNVVHSNKTQTSIIEGIWDKGSLNATNSVLVWLPRDPSSFIVFPEVSFHNYYNHVYLNHHYLHTVATLWAQCICPSQRKIRIGFPQPQLIRALIPKWSTYTTHPCPKTEAILLHKGVKRWRGAEDGADCLEMVSLWMWQSCCTHEHATVAPCTIQTSQHPNTDVGGALKDSLFSWGATGRWRLQVWDSW